MDVLDFVFTVIAVILAVAFGVVVLPIAGVVLLIRYIWRRTHPNKTLQPGTAEAYAFLEEGATQEAVTSIAQTYVDDEALGPYAQGVLDSFRNCDMRSKAIHAVLDDEFEKSSLTWEKYHAPVEVAVDRVVQNAAQIVNRMQAFDSKEFLRMGRLEKAGAYSAESPETGRLAVMRATLEEMDEYQKTNDQLLVELEKLQAELMKLSGAGYDSETDEIITEIRKLADDAKYYS